MVPLKSIKSLLKNDKMEKKKNIIRISDWKKSLGEIINFNELFMMLRYNYLKLFNLSNLFLFLYITSVCIYTKQIINLTKLIKIIKLFNFN